MLELRRIRSRMATCVCCSRHRAAAIRAILHPCATAPGAAIYVGGALGAFEGPAGGLYGRLQDVATQHDERPACALPPAR